MAELAWAGLPERRIFRAGGLPDLLPSRAFSKKGPTRRAGMAGGRLGVGIRGSNNRPEGTRTHGGGQKSPWFELRERPRGEGSVLRANCPGSGRRFWVMFCGTWPEQPAVFSCQQCS